MNENRFRDGRHDINNGNRKISEAFDRLNSTVQVTRGKAVQLENQADDMVTGIEGRIQDSFTEAQKMADEIEGRIRTTVQDSFQEANQWVDKLEQRVVSTRTTMGGELDQILSRVDQFVDNVRVRVNENFGTASSLVDRTETFLREMEHPARYVRENPARALAGAFAAGIVASTILRRMSERRASAGSMGGGMSDMSGGILRGSSTGRTAAGTGTVGLESASEDLDVDDVNRDAETEIQVTIKKGEAA